MPDIIDVIFFAEKPAQAPESMSWKSDFEIWM